MNPFSGASWSATTFAFGLGVAAKATAILMIVLFIQSLLRNRRAFLGSAVGNAGLVGLLVLPVAALALPSLPIACLPAGVSISQLDAAAVSDSHSASGWAHIPARDVFPIGPEADHAWAAPQLAGKLVRASDDSPRVPPAQVMHGEGLPIGSTRPRGIDWAALAIMGYALGALLSDSAPGYFDAGRGAASTILREGRRHTVDQGTGALAAKLEIGRAVDLAWSRGVSVPVVLGWLRPMIVLPSVTDRQKLA